VAVVPNVNVSILFAISVVSQTPCLLNHRSDARFCADIVSAPAARRIAALERDSESLQPGFSFFIKPNQISQSCEKAAIRLCAYGPAVIITACIPSSSEKSLL